MKVGDRVRIASAHYTTDTGQMVDLRAIEELPAVQLVDRDQAVAILREGGYVRCAVIVYEFSDNGNTITPMFVALEDGKGNWWDLRGRALVITPIVEQLKFDAAGTGNAYPD